MTRSEGKRSPERRLLIRLSVPMLVVLVILCGFAVAEVSVGGVSALLAVVLSMLLFGWVVLVSAIGAWFGYKRSQR